jgi:hypothetical protein
MTPISPVLVQGTAAGSEPVEGENGRRKALEMHAERAYAEAAHSVVCEPRWPRGAAQATPLSRRTPPGSAATQYWSSFLRTPRRERSLWIGRKPSSASAQVQCSCAQIFICPWTRLTRTTPWLMLALGRIAGNVKYTT